jgi:hypothetical protein
MDQYRFISIERYYLSWYSLNDPEKYSFNYLRKDNFDFWPMKGKRIIRFNIVQRSFPYPEFGFKAKHFNFLEANDIKYSSVATWWPNCILNQ